MQRLVPLLLAALAAGPAHAGDVSVGVGVGVSSDLPDAIADGHTRFPAVPEVVVPLRWQPLPLLAARARLRLAAGPGRDRLTWNEYIAGENVRFSDDGAAAVLGVAALTLGLELRGPAHWRLTPLGGVSVGLGVLANWHGLDGELAFLASPLAQDGQGVGPYTVQAAVISEVHLGVALHVNRTVDLWFETGYSHAALATRSLQNARGGIDSAREAYGWNALAASLGLSVSLSGGRAEGGRADGAVEGPQ